MKKYPLHWIWWFLLPILMIDCNPSGPTGFTQIEIPENISSLYDEVAAFQPLKGSSVTSLDISSLLKNFDGVTQAYVVEYDSVYFYEPRVEQISKNSIPVIPSDKNILVVLDLGEIARNNYALITDFSKFEEFSVEAVQNKICTRILCSPDVFKIDRVFDDIPDIQKYKGSFDFHRGPLGKVPAVQAKGICQLCYRKPSPIFPCIFKGCPVFPFWRRPYVRRNFNTLTVANKNLVNQGVGVMKSRAETVTDSWVYQANMHGAPSDAAPQPLFDGCQHGTLHFYTWHRMYLYYFERILRKASADPRVTLPYWNYSLTGSRSLPPEFQDPASNFYNANRNEWANTNGELPDDFVDVTNALSQSNFNSFSSSAESTPHDGVHVLIGQDMGAFATAGRDPIFWLHHCNIDRLWNKWLNASGHANPVDPGWLATSYEFFNENGVRVSLSASDVLNTLHQLNYRYDDDPVTYPKFEIAVAMQGPPFQQPRKIIGTMDLPTKLSEKPVSLKITLPREKIQSLKAASQDTKKTLLVFEDFEFEESVGTSFRVFINPSKEEDLDASGQPSFVGLINLFGKHGDHQHNVEIDITNFLHKKANTLDEALRVVIAPARPLVKDSKGQKKYEVKVKGNPRFKKMSIVEF